MFERDGDDLVLPLSLNVAQATLGGDVRIPMIDGSAEELEVPAGTQHGHVFRLHGKGVPHLRGRGRGDLRVQVGLRIPAKLSAEQRELFEQLSDMLDEGEDGSGRANVFSRIRGAFTA